MTEFRIQNFRSILDSGWIEVDDIAAIVGKNESGKTSLLKALWKFNPYNDKDSYVIDREFPRGKRKEKSSEKVVATVRFKFTDEEVDQIASIDESTQGITGVEIERTYKGTHIYRFLPNNPDRDFALKWVISVIKESFGELPEIVSDNFKLQYQTAFSTFVDQVSQGDGSKFAISQAPVFKSNLQAFVQTGEDQQVVQQLHQAIDRALIELGKKPPFQQAVDTAHQWLPTFIYMNDYKIFTGTAQLNQVLDRKKARQLTEADRTIILIMEMAGLDLADEVRKGAVLDREQRMLDMNDASQTLTDEIAHRWSQKQYEVMFQADGYHFITFVKDLDSKVLIPLEERSQGFQWFFSFDMTFMYETEGEFQNSIILLDEPGLHLYGSAQRDLLLRMKSYAKNNQLVYTTHLPFMIDFNRLDNIYVAEELLEKGTKVHRDWATAGEDSRFTLQAALGLSWSQSLFVGQYNLIVEGVTDFWFLTTISTILQDANLAGIDEQLVITPAGGASKVAYVGTILHGQKLDVMVLLDSDQEGKNAYEQLVNQWIMDNKYVLMLGEVLGLPHSCALEDLFSESYYLEFVQSAYNKELGKKTLKLSKESNQSIVDRVETALKSHGIEHYNKGRVAKRIMKDLAQKTLADLPEDTINNFKKVIDSINKIVKTWRK
jgi:predicted ATP-dependent endonuclease of OLD family